MSPRPRVLIVDDALDNLHILLAILKDTWDIQAATSGSRALEMARRDPQPDLILLDVVMPEMNGFETFQKLRGDPSTQHIPVIFATGLEDTEDQIKGLELGAADYILKPFIPQLVRARLRNQLESKRHRDYVLAEARNKNAELEVARRLQTSVLRAADFEDIRHRGCQIGCLLRPARSVGADLYDYFMQEDNKLIFLAGDVSHKGLSAAVFMLRVTTLLRTLAPYALEPAKLLGRMNEHLCQDNPACMFVKMLCGCFNLETGEVEMASAGHEPPLQLRKRGSSRYLELESGPALGLCTDAAYINHQFQLEADQLLLLYTDGVTEAFDEKGERFGAQRLLAAAEQHWKDSPVALITAIADELSTFVNQAEQYDDITLLVLRCIS